MERILGSLRSGRFYKFDIIYQGFFFFYNNCQQSLISDMTQREFFQKTKTVSLFNLRWQKTCYYPQNEGDPPDYDNDQGKVWLINKELLYQELSKRHNRF